MKKVFVVSSVDVAGVLGTTKEAKKVARLLKKAHESVFGLGTCEVVVVPSGLCVAEVASEG